MRTRSQSRNQNRPQQQAPPVVVDPFNLEEPFDNPPVVNMAANGAGGAGPPPAGGGGLPVPDLRTMEELCQPSLDGRGGPIAPIAIQATTFGLKNDMIQQVQNSCPFRGPGDDANKHLDKFGLADSDPLLYLYYILIAFKETTNLQNEISNFQQKFDESFHEAWDRYKDLIRACPYRGFTELHQLDTFYNALNPSDQDSLNSAAVVSQVKSSDGNSVPMPPPLINLEDDERVEETLTDLEHGEYTIKVPPPQVQKAKPPSQRRYLRWSSSLLSVSRRRWQHFPGVSG
ncbi:reverse transcriptase domain-containing protein [Tanacetum coccineum]